MEVRCAGDSPKDNSKCMNEAVSVLYLFSLWLPPLRGKGRRGRKKNYIYMCVYIHIYIYISAIAGSVLSEVSH